jgi:putative ABC transport system permease protein
MLRATCRKALADLIGRPLQAVLLFAVIAAAATTLSLALNVQASAARPYERLREQSNSADVWINAVDARSDLSKVEGLPGVKAVSGPYPISFTNYGIRNGDKKQQIALVGMGPRLPDVDSPVVTDGHWLSASGTDEIVIDRGAALILKLEIGQRIEMLTPNGTRTFTVIGFAVPTGRAPAPLSEPAFAFVLPETLQRIEPAAVFGTSLQYTLRLGVQLQDASTAGQFFAEARAAIGGPFGLVSWQSVREILKEANTFDVIFLSVFSFFALFAAGLIIANAIGGQVLSQLRDIGILKAIGFTPGQVTLALLMQNLVLSFVASLAGVFIGLMLAPFFLERSAESLGVPASAAFNLGVVAIVMVAIALIVILFTLFPAWRAGRVGAIQALNAGNDSGPGRASRLAEAAGRLGLPRVAVIGLKDLSRRPVRTALTVAALVFAVVTATFSLGIEATFNATMSDATVIGLPPYDIVADRDLLTDAEARRIIESRPEVENYLAWYDSQGRQGDVYFGLAGFDGNLNEPEWAVREGRMPERAGEAALSNQLARDLGLSVGDRTTIEVVQDGEPFDAWVHVDVQIVGRYLDLGDVPIAVKAETLPPGGEVADYMIRTRPGTDNHAFAGTLIEASAGNFDPEVISDSIGDVRDQFRSVLLGLNAVLFAIAGINLLSSLLLSTRERRRDFAVLKTVGFTPGQVAQSVFAGSALLALVAVVAGLPLGLAATRLMFDVLSSSIGGDTGVGQMPGVLWLLPLIPGAIAVVTLASVLPARRAAAVQVAEALRYE